MVAAVIYKWDRMWALKVLFCVFWATAFRWYIILRIYYSEGWRFLLSSEYFIVRAFSSVFGIMLSSLYKAAFSLHKFQKEYLIEEDSAASTSSVLSFSVFFWVFSEPLWCLKSSCFHLHPPEKIQTFPSITHRKSRYQCSGSSLAAHRFLLKALELFSNSW